MDLTNSLQKLAGYHPFKSQKSQDTLDECVTLLKNGGFAKQGDDGWESLEKLTLAALDQGDLAVADQCLQLIVDKFPGSPRGETLQGIRMEATASPEVALKYYEELLEADPANATAWRRKASILRRMGKIDLAVQELSAMLDTFYADVDGWLELADIYASCQQYTYALQSISHALLLAPQNPFYFLHFAEMAYLANDILLSLKMFLVAVDMTDDDDGPVPPQDSIPAGPTLRAWYGVKLCTRRLIIEPRLLSSSASHTTAPDAITLSNVDELSTERLRTAYMNMKGESAPKVDEDLIAQLATMIE